MQEITGLLEQLLLVLKQVLLLSVHLLVVSVAVGVLEDLSAPNDLLDGCDQEIQFNLGVVLQSVQQLDLVVDYWHQLFGVLLRLVVVVVALEVEHVLLQFKLGVAYLFGLCVILLELVALVVPSSI